MNSMVGLPNEAAATGSLQFLPRPNQTRLFAGELSGELWLHLFYQNSVLLFFNLCPSPRMKRVPLFLMAHVLIVRGKQSLKHLRSLHATERKHTGFFEAAPP